MSQDSGSTLNGRSLPAGGHSAFALLLFGLLLGACDSQPPPASSFYDERIGPRLEFGCVEQTAGCHLASAAGEATGNLDLSSFDALMRRRDVIPPFGPYSVGLLLLKGGPDIDVTVETWDPTATGERFVPITTDIRHNAGARVDLESTDYGLLKQWIEGGFQRTGIPPEELAVNRGPCRNGVGTGVGYETYDPMNLPGNGLERFRAEVQPLLREHCAGSSCHGSRVGDLYLACGDNEDEIRWNYWVAVQHLTDPVSTSELLRRPLSQLRGGTFHEGGNVFASAEDAVYRVIRGWAEELITADPTVVLDPVAQLPLTEERGLRFFANRVQPVLVRKGCMFLNCHSVSMFHDLRLRGGSQGVFSRVATRRNYEMSRLLLAIESPNPNDSRIVAKNLYPDDFVSGGEGMLHRGGPLFEDFGITGTSPTRATPAECMGVDADAGDLNTVPAYCVLARWHEIEREEAIASGEIIDPAIRGVVWVSRPPGVGDVRDFDTYRGGADLRFADAVIDAAGAITLSGDRSLLAGCGLTGDVDVRTPAVSWDAARIAFAARSGGGPLRLYWMASDGTGCERIPGIAPGSDNENGIDTHDFDPAWAPDGRMVFASTRGNLVGGHSYSGPTRTPAAMQPNANLYIFESGEVRQLTFLLNQEVAPSFMADGRVIFTTEKREPDFHQLAGRRQQLDGGDYHPLFAQRGSVGFDSATEIVELANRNLAIVAGAVGSPDGAGTIAIVNRSIGPDQDDRPGGDRFYLSSMTFPVGGPGAMGAYRSPYPLPGGRLLVSCDTGAMPGGSNIAFSLCEIIPTTGAVRTVGGDAGRANVEAVAVYARPQNGVFVSRADEANGHTTVVPGETDAVVTIHDMPLLGTLLFTNTREGRPLDDRIEGLAVFEALPPTGGEGPNTTDGLGMLYTNYQLLGTTDLFGDGSRTIRIPGGTPVLLAATDDAGNVLTFQGDDAPFSGDMIQREQMQFYPGERSNQSFQRRFFNGLCGGCHGSISGRELDIAVNVDILTSASQTQAVGADPVDMMR